MAEGDRGKEPSPNECPKCGGPIVRDHQRSQEVCSKCGFIVRENIKDRGPEWRSYDEESEDRSRGGVPVSENFHDKGLGTTISSSTIDGKGRSLSPETRSSLWRWRRLNGRVALKGTRGLNVGLDRIRTAWSHFSLPKGVRQRASRLYRLASDEGLVKGRTRDAFAVAALDQACRESSVKGDLEGFADCLGIDPDRAKEAKKILVSKFSLASPIKGISKWVQEIKGKFKPLRDQTKNRILELVRKVEGADLPPSFSSRGKKGLAGAIIYLAFVEEGHPVSESKVAGEAGVSRTTIQNSVGQIEKVLGEEISSQDHNEKGGEKS